MSAKYMRTMEDRMRAEQKRKATHRGLSLQVQESKQPMEPGMYAVSCLGTAILTVMLFAVWFVAG